MSDVPTLITYGGGDILANVFNGIAATVGDDAYKTVLRLAGLIALLWVIVEVAITHQHMKLLTWLGSFFLLINILLVPKMTVVIEDKLNNDAVYPVDNVPIGVGYVAIIASQIGYVLTSKFDEVFSLPNDLQYSQTGLVMGSRLVSDAMRFQITNATFSKNITSFMQQCVFYDILLGKYTANDLFSTSDIWSFITQNASPARAFKYITDEGVGNSSTIYTCQQGINQLNSDWNKEIQQAATVYGQRFFATSNTNAKSELLSRLPIAFNYLTQTSQSAESIMMQAMTANAIQHALLGNASESAASAAVGQYASTRAEQMQMSKFLITGDVAAHWLSIMQNVIQALLYGGFLLVILTVLLPHGHRVMLHYIQSIVWVQLWAPLYAILNLVMTMGAGHESMAAIANTTGAAAAFTLNTYAGLAKVNADMAAFAGFATMSIPLIAWGMVKFTGLAVTSLASSLASVSQSVASRVAEDVTSGNLSYGNLQFDTQSAFNTSANHFNTNASFQSGMSSYQTPSGAMIQHTLDGSTVINSQGAISSTGTSINFADSMREQATMQSEKSFTAAQTHASAFSQSMSSAFRDIMEFSTSVGHSSSSDNAWSQSHSGTIVDSADKVTQHIERFAADHHLSNDEAARIVGDAYAKAGSSKLLKMVGIQAGAGMNLSGSGSAVSGETWRDANDMVSQDSFRHNADTALRAAHDVHYKTGNDEGHRLLDNISSSYDKAMTARSEMSNSLTQAESYRKTASFAEENAVAVNTNASQSLVDWMIQQPDGHGGQLGTVGAEQVLNSNPTLAQDYANHFITSEVNTLANQFRHTSLSEATIKQDDEQASQTASYDNAIKENDAAYRQTIQQDAQEKELTNQPIDSSLQATVSQTLNQATAERQGLEGDTESKGHFIQNGVDAELKTPNQSLVHQALSKEGDIIKDTLTKWID